MALLEMRSEYEQIKSSWRGRPPGEHRFVLARVHELRIEAEESNEEGTEYLLVELEDLMAQIGHPVHAQHAARQAPVFNEPSDAM